MGSFWISRAQEEESDSPPESCHQRNTKRNLSASHLERGEGNKKKKQNKPQQKSKPLLLSCHISNQYQQKNMIPELNENTPFS